MNIFERAGRDLRNITSNPDGSGEQIFLVWPDSSELELYGIAAKHHLGIDTDGNQVNTKTAHISFSESIITDAGKSIRTNGEVNLNRFKVRVKDSTGTEKSYIVRMHHPDETFGHIVCILGKME